MVKQFLKWLQALIRSIPGEDGLCEFQCAEPHDPEAKARMQFDDDFNFERWKP